ncbi:hypothetical protein [Rhizobacter sp. Root1221]|uniref:hypothetical protein n=1 Tax=Rhizobacter sp. Root1221 TaxID=1736433 RepID=UPI0006FE07C4|nr:hypothetical protein [Rhizobacter sp. Root1221]KQV99912.1 hypothetical protein ASC87_19585 [Rhizobacter sp. Root1221]
MPLPPAPFKTPLGLDELRHRTRGLGQRHRTVLLLVDGNRPLGEVLGMAHRAGASTSHFEELVRLGLVEMPVEPAPEAQETAPGALDLPKLTSVEVEVPAEPDYPVLHLEAIPGPVAAAHDDGPDTVGNPDVEPIPELVTAMASPPEPEPEPVPAPAPAPRVAAPPPAPRRPPPARPPKIQFRDTPDELADHARPRPAASEELLRHQVRSLLVGAMGAEATLFSPLTLSRIRAAQTSRDLITLVWEIERQRNHVRRNRAQLLSLEKARELLGMGNTLVAGDSQAGAVWPDTHGN